MLSDHTAKRGCSFGTYGTYSHAIDTPTNIQSDKYPKRQSVYPDRVLGYAEKWDHLESLLCQLEGHTVRPNAESGGVSVSLFQRVTDCDQGQAQQLQQNYWNLGHTIALGEISQRVVGASLLADLQAWLWQ